MRKSAGRLLAWVLCALVGFALVLGTEGHASQFFTTGMDVFKQDSSGAITITIPLRTSNQSRYFSGVVSYDTSQNLQFECASSLQLPFSNMQGQRNFTFRVVPKQGVPNGFYTLAFAVSYTMEADTRLFNDATPVPGDSIYSVETINVVVEVTGNPATAIPSVRPEATPRAIANDGDLVVDDYYTIAADDSSGNVLVNLPLRYKGSPFVRNQLSFLEVAPSVEDPEKFPFALNFTGQLRNRDSIQSKLVDGSRTIEYVSFPFKVAKDTENGFYPITFTARYLDMTQNVRTEKPTETKLTIYVQVKNGKNPPGPTKDPSVTEKPQSDPKLIITEYSYSPKPVEAGQVFELDLEVYNTHASRYVQNVTVSLVSDKDVISPAEGSTTFYLPRIDAKGKVQQTLKLMANPNASPEPNNITVSIKYEDDKVNKLEAEQVFSVDIQQVPRLVLDKAAIDASELSVEDRADISLPIYNKGKGTLQNVTATLVSEDMIAESDYYAGNLEPGSSKTCEITFGLNPTEEFMMGMGVAKGRIDVVFEDAYGVESTQSVEVEIPVIPAATPRPPMDMTDVMANPEEKDSKTAPIAAIAGGGAMLAGGGVALSRSIRKRKEAEEELETDEME